MSLAIAVQLLKEHAIATQDQQTLAPHIQPLQDERPLRQALGYLDFFGYLSQSLPGWSDISLGDIIDAIKKFQGMFGLGDSGNLTPQTLRVMTQSRCGHPDFVRPDNVEALRLQSFADSNLARWQKTALTYCITDYLPNLSKTDFETLVGSAFGSWMQYANIHVARTTDPNADIIISTGQGANDQFDGPGGTLAWAYLPSGNDSQLLMKFDLDEHWLLTPNQQGILILNVATHEFGHLLGLTHSKVQSALMAPYYNQSISAPQQNDDIPRIQARYGPPVATPPAPSPDPAPVPVPVPVKASINIQTNGVCNVVVDGRQIV